MSDDSMFALKMLQGATVTSVALEADVNALKDAVTMEFAKEHGGSIITGTARVCHDASGHLCLWIPKWNETRKV